MRFLRNRRRAAAAGALALVVAVALGVVLPALASNPGDYVAPESTTAHVLPTDVAIGGTGDCANLFPNGLGGTYSEYDNVNPKTMRSFVGSGNNDGAMFKLTMNTTDKKNETLDVTSTGAAIVAIGIKGGTQSTAYDYVNGPYVTGTNNGSVTGDTGLHAPAQTWTTTTVGGYTAEVGSQYYSISQLTVCYRQGSVGGTVYRDVNVNGTYDSGSDSTLSGWAIHLYDGATQVGTGTSDATGAYKIGAIFDPTKTYTVCEVPPSGSGAWAQTEPGAGSALCSGTGELKRGWSFTPANSLDNVTKNFGNVGAITCTSGPFGIPGYQVGTCKPTQTYVFTSGTVNGKPYVSYWVGDPTQTSVPTVEKITFDDPWSSTGPTLTKILYEDTSGFETPTDGASQMPYCNIDPRDISAANYPESYALKSPYDASTNGVLPTGGATSCLISLKITAPAGGSTNGMIVAYVYSSTDSFRVGA